MLLECNNLQGLPLPDSGNLEPRVTFWHDVGSFSEGLREKFVLGNTIPLNTRHKY